MPESTLIDILKNNSRVFVIATTSKEKIAEYQRLLNGSDCVLSLTDFAKLSGIALSKLESKEEEKDYQDIAKGKVLKVQQAITNNQLDTFISKTKLNKLFIIGDDYGVSINALPFTYDSTLKDQQLFTVDSDNNNCVTAIRTSRQSLDGKGAPAYFSHRIIKSIGLEAGLDEKAPDFKQKAFKIAAGHFITEACKTHNFTSTATTAVAMAQGLNSPTIYEKTGNYTLISSIAEMATTGFDFDRILEVASGGTIANLTPETKDKQCPRGIALQKALANLPPVPTKAKKSEEEHQQALIMQQAMNISAIDGRYQEKTAELRPVMSEFALMRERLRVEIAWFNALAKEKKFKALSPLSDEENTFLESLVQNFSEADFLAIKKHEKKYKHDVKAVEYFIKEKIKNKAPETLKEKIELVHFACTSADINNTAYALMLKEARDSVLLPYMDAIINSILLQAERYKDLAMLARTHGQPATPTTLGKEWANFANRLKISRDALAALPISAKMNGATGNYNAHITTVSDVNWPRFAKNVLHQLGLQQTKMTTQIEPHDNMARFFKEFTIFCTVLKNLDLNTWLTIKDNYFSLKLEEGQVGSSTMPHKINPIDFENSEGNFDIAISGLQNLATSLSQSRLQRDLTDSTKKRTIAEIFGHALIAFQSFLAGIYKLETNESIIKADLETHWELLAEPIQTVMRYHGLNNPYERLKLLTQQQEVTENTIHTFIDSLQNELPSNVIDKLKTMTPTNYVGIAGVLTNKTVQSIRHGSKRHHKKNKTAVDAVVGLQWGDEGKGKLTDKKASSQKYHIVARYNGGANAGHSLQVGDGEKIHTHLMPSGILTKGVVNVIGNGVVLDPWQLLKEIRAFKEKGIAVTAQNLKISERCHLVLPYHKEEDALNEAINSQGAQAVGTTKKGIGPSYADKAHRTTAIRFCSLFEDDEKLKTKLQQIVKQKKAAHAALAKAYELDFDAEQTKEQTGANGEVLFPYDADKLFSALKEVRDELMPFKTDTVSYLNKQIKKGQRVLVEGANAFMLDKDFGTYPFVTSSNASVNGIAAGLGIPPKKIGHVTGIVKAYATRVGEGPMPTELNEKHSDKSKHDYEADYIANRLREEGKEYGTTTGRPRRCGWLDLMPVKYAIQTSGVDNLSIMLLDVLKVVKTDEKIKICVGYELNSKKISLGKMPAESNTLARCKPIYKEFEPFGDISHCRSYNDLPKEAKTYLRFIEEKLNCPIEHVSYGPKREQTLYIRGGISRYERRLERRKSHITKAMNYAIGCLSFSATEDAKTQKQLVCDALKENDFTTAKSRLIAFVKMLRQDNTTANKPFLHTLLFKAPAPERVFFHTLHCHQHSINTLFGESMDKFQKEIDIAQSIDSPPPIMTC